jgi:hypothetical protein
MSMTPGDIFGSIDPQTGLRRAEDYQFKSVMLYAFDGQGYDIRFLMGEINLREDLFNGCCSGTISLIDSVSLPELMPLVGEERLEIVFTKYTTGLFNSDVFPDYVMKFRVYDISAREVSDHKRQNYILHLVSEEFLNNFRFKISRAFCNPAMPYSDMVQKVFDEKIKVTKDIYIEPTKHDHKYVAPNITPFEMFNVLASRSVSEKGYGVGYVFYEDKDQFNFVPIGKLLNQKELPGVYVYRTKNLGYGDFKMRELEEETRNVTRYQYSGMFNVLKNLTGGMYASRLITVDPLRQQINKLDFDVEKEFKKFIHMETVKPWTPGQLCLGSIQSHIKCTTTDTFHDTLAHISSKEPGIKPKNVEEYVLHRTSELHQTDTIKMMINVPGNPTFKAGQVINFQVPSNIGKLSEAYKEEPDKYLSGRYLIVSLMHNIHDAGYSCQMEIIKDTLLSPIVQVDPVNLFKGII